VFDSLLPQLMVNEISFMPKLSPFQWLVQSKSGDIFLNAQLVPESQRSLDRDAPSVQTTMSIFDEGKCRSVARVLTFELSEQ
jgi:hypothetical protein